MLVAGLGAFAYGRERRAVTVLGRVPGVNPVFLVPRFGDGTTAKLVRSQGHRCEMVPVGYLGRARVWWTAKSLALLPAANTRAALAYERHACDGVVCLHLLTVLRFLPFLLWVSRIHRHRIVLYVGDMLAERWIHRRLGSLCRMLANDIIANSIAVKSSLVRLGLPAEAIRVVYNGVEASGLRSAYPMDFRRLFGWPADAVLVGYAGQLRPEKGVGDLLRAARSLCGSRRDYRYVIAGGTSDGAYLSRCRDFVQRNGLTKRVAFLGKIEDVGGFYRGVDLVVVPSRYPDPAPNVVLEAQASGRPLVSTRTGGIPELLEDGASGLLVPSGDPVSLARAIEVLGSSEDVRERMGARGIRWVAAGFDLDKNAAEVGRAIAGT